MGTFLKLLAIIFTLGLAAPLFLFEPDEDQETGDTLGHTPTAFEEFRNI